MTPAESLQATPVPASIDNPAGWDELAAQLQAETGVPTVLTPESLTHMLASAVPLLFSADAAKDMNRLRGTFADAIIAQCQRNAGCLQGAHPAAIKIHLISAHLDNGHPTLRLHLAIQLAGGESTVAGQVWDLQLGAQATVGQTSCPNCGAPLAPGELICSHCDADVRSVVNVPLLVSRLELY